VKTESWRLKSLKRRKKDNEEAGGSFQEYKQYKRTQNSFLKIKRLKKMNPETKFREKAGKSK